LGKNKINWDPNPSLWAANEGNPLSYKRYDRIVKNKI